MTGLLESEQPRQPGRRPGRGGQIVAAAEIRRRDAAGRAVGDLSGHDGRRGRGAGEGRLRGSTPSPASCSTRRCRPRLRGGRVVVDETSMLGHKDAVKLFKLAEKLDLKLIFVGDPMQHGSVPRGALMRVLKEYGGIQPFRLTRDHAAGNAGIPGGGQAAFGGEDAGRLRRPRPAGLGQGDGRRRRSATGRSRPITCRRWNDKKSVPGRVARRTPKRPAITRGIRSELRQAGKLGAEDANSPGWCGRRQRGGAGAGDHVPAGRRASSSTRTPRGFTKGDRLIGHRSGGGAARRGRQVSRSTGRKPSRWPRATGSGSPAR